MNVSLKAHAKLPALAEPEPVPVAYPIPPVTLPEVIAEREPSAALSAFFALQAEVKLAAAELDTARDAAAADARERPEDSEVIEAVDDDTRARAAAQMLLVHGPLLCIASSEYALRDPTGCAADRVIHVSFNLHPSSQVRPPEFRAGLYTESRRLAGAEYSSLIGRDRAYYATGVRLEAQRDAADAARPEWDRLGFTPKGRRSTRLTPSERMRLNAEAVAVHEEDPRFDSDSGIEELVANRERLDRLIENAALTERQDRVIRLMRDGLTEAEACREAHEPRSTARAAIQKLQRTADRQR